MTNYKLDLFKINNIYEKYYLDFFKYCYLLTLNYFLKIYFILMGYRSRLSCLKVLLKLDLILEINFIKIIIAIKAIAYFKRNLAFFQKMTLMVIYKFAVIFNPCFVEVNHFCLNSVFFLNLNSKIAIIFLKYFKIIIWIFLHFSQFHH